MSGPFQFQKQILDCMVGGVSVLDIPNLNIHSAEHAKSFIEAYGYNLDEARDVEELLSTHRRAVALIKDQLMEPGERIPDELFDPAKLTDVGQLLIYASNKKSADPHARELQRWSCAILRVMHVFVHLRNDLFSAFNEEIQSQILKPLQESIVSDSASNQIALGGLQDGIPLYRFDIKPFKTTASSVIKLLARPERVALTLLDKLGVRFVTRSVYDSFRVIRFLSEKNILNYAHIIPDQSNNTLYPLNIFMETMQELSHEGRNLSVAEIESRLAKHASATGDRARFLQKMNEFSGADYKFIKFINRKLITVPVNRGGETKPFRFFYPYEIQIMDYDTHVSNLSGPMAHDAYKDRQRLRARQRVLPENGQLTGGEV